MGETFDEERERRRDRKAREEGVRPEHAPGKDVPDRRGPRKADEPGKVPPFTDG